MKIRWNGGKNQQKTRTMIGAWHDNQRRVTSVLTASFSSLSVGSCILNRAMVKKALSDNVKNLKKHQANEHQVKQASATYQAGQAGYTPKRSLRDIASEHNVNFSTLTCRVKGQGKSMLDFNAAKQKLPPTEELVLVTFILESADIRFPLSHRQIERHANAVLESKQGTNCEKVGKQWVFNFLTWHYEALQPHWSKPLDTQHAKSLNPAAVKSWFDLLKKFVVELGVRKEDIYGMDESGFPTAYTGKERVVRAWGTKTQHKQGGANQENVTAIVTICTDGTTIKPMIIYKGKNMMQKWGDNNVSNAQWVNFMMKGKKTDLPQAFLIPKMDGLMEHWDISGLRLSSIPRPRRKLEVNHAS